MRYRSCKAQSYARRVELVEIQGKGEYFQKPSEWPPKVSLFRLSRTATRMPIIFKIVLTADIKVSPQESIGKDFHRLAHHFGKRVAEDLIYQVLRGSR